MSNSPHKQGVSKCCDKCYKKDRNCIYGGCPCHQEKNQCDGCLKGMPLQGKGGFHTENGRVVMMCQKDRYSTPLSSKAEKIKRGAEDFANRFEGVMKDLSGKAEECGCPITGIGKIHKTTCLSSSAAEIIESLADWDGVCAACKKFGKRKGCYTCASSDSQEEHVSNMQHSSNNVTRPQEKEEDHKGNCNCFECAKKLHKIVDEALKELPQEPKRKLEERLSKIFDDEWQNRPDTPTLVKIFIKQLLAQEKEKSRQEAIQEYKANRTMDFCNAEEATQAERSRVLEEVNNLKKEIPTEVKMTGHPDSIMDNLKDIAQHAMDMGFNNALYKIETIINNKGDKK